MVAGRGAYISKLVIIKQRAALLDFRSAHIIQYNLATSFSTYLIHLLARTHTKRFHIGLFRRIDPATSNRYARKSHPKGKIYTIFFSLAVSSSVPRRAPPRLCMGSATVRGACMHCMHMRPFRCTGLLWLESKRDATHNWESVMSRASPAGTPHVVTVPHTRQGATCLCFFASLARLLAPVLYVYSRRTSPDLTSSSSRKSQTRPLAG